MSPNRRNIPPPGARPPGLGSSVLPSSRDDQNEAEPGFAGDTGIDAPQLEWVYNSDHTDRVNFGYMFLKPVGTRPSRATADPSHASVPTPATPFVPPPLNENADSYPTPIAVTSSLNEGHTQSSQPSNFGHSYVSSAGVPSGSNDHVKQFSHTHPYRSSSETSSQDSFHQNVPYRTGPYFRISPNPPLEQLTPPESLHWSAA